MSLKKHRYTAAARMPLWKWMLCLIGGVVLFVVLYVLAQAGPLLISKDYLSILVSLGSGLLGLFLYAVWTNLTERRPITELALSRMWKDLGLGLLVGVLFFVVVVGLMALLGSYTITEAHFNWQPHLRTFCFFFMVAVFEEIIFRGVLFRLMDDRWCTAVALIVSALAFGFLHVFNPGATLWSSFAIAIEAGLLLGAAYKFTGTLWLPIGIHWAWNYVQGSIWGFAVSGIAPEEKLFSAVITGSDWVTGGIFGAEASLPAVCVGFLLTIILLCNAKYTSNR